MSKPEADTFAEIAGTYMAQRDRLLAACDAFFQCLSQLPGDTEIPFAVALLICDLRQAVDAVKSLDQVKA